LFASLSLATLGCGGDSQPSEFSSSGGGTASGGTSTGTGGAATGGSTTGGVASTNTGWGTATLPAATAPCAALVYDENVTVADTPSDRFTFGDLGCLPRAAAMARNDRGYLRQFTYQYDGKTRTATGTGVNGWDGWGFIVNHGLGGDTTSSMYHTVYVGTHHAIYEYKTVKAGITITRQWFFASGRNNPIVAITFDMTAVSPGIGADTRTPYGDIAWDGDEYFPNTVVSGVAWGDRYKFITTKAPLALSSSWDYSQPNLVPYCLEWADLADAEMGMVQTQTYLQKDAGGYWEYKNWGKDSTTQIRDAIDQQPSEMPASWNWTYQLNQYELCFQQGDVCINNPTNSHRISWGTNYGAIGGNDATGAYPAYGDDKQLIGYPYNSYSVFMVLGKHSDEAVFDQMAEIETVQKTSLAATVGTVVTMLPAGVNRTDLATLDPPGYDARYSTWNVAADANRAEFTATVSAGALLDPVVVVSNYTGATVPTVKMNGVAGVADVDYLASLDPATQTVWITFRPGWEGVEQITIE
jgi:hypothetical protein